MKKVNNWTLADVAWHVDRFRELLTEDPKTALEIIKKEKKTRMKLRKLQLLGVI